MNKLRRIFSFFGFIIIAMPFLAAEPDLPKTEILGKEYYYHEIKKGESIYGIARQHSWNLDELIRLNPTASSEMKKGTRLYYPTGRVTVLTEVKDVEPEFSEEPEPIRHTVKKGETIYAISRQYGIPLETVYALYPDSKYGIKAGDVLEFPQGKNGTTGKYLFYEIKQGDTLYAIAKKYHTTIEDILKDNSGLSENNLKTGETIRISVNSNARKLKTELVEEERLAGIDSYKVKKNDTWTKISEKTGIDVETLKDANENVTELKKNEVINLPLIQVVEVEKEVIPEDPRELTEEGIQEIYDSIHQVNSDELRLKEVKVALLLDEPTSKKDLDFTRGIMIALDEMKNSPYKINLKVIDGRTSINKVKDALEAFQPNLLIATADKSFPAFLADYGETNHVEIINVFDVKNDLFEENPSMVQLLPPSGLFNEQTVENILSGYDGRELLLVGQPDENDAIAELLQSKYNSKRVKKIQVESLGSYDFSDNGSYLIYAYPQKKDEVGQILEVVNYVKEKSPMADIAIVGRPNWITFTDIFRGKFNDAEILVPARCWFDPESREGKQLLDKYEEMFGGEPTKSFPNFTVSGYDTAKYFINTTMKNGGDYNRPVYSNISGLQTDFNLKRVSNWGGFVNSITYLLKFRPSGYVEKISL